MKTNNQDGYVIILALMLLSLVSLAGIMAMQQTTAELQMAGNDAVHKRCFWNAESGISVGISNLQQMLTDSGQLVDPTIDWEGYLSHDSSPFYTVWIIHKIKDGKIVYYGDTNNDYLMEYNTDSIGWPVEIVFSEGTDHQGGNVGIM
ncbi:MAG: hypothetical protein PVG65_00785, partial [Candidatus Thorarchaeota archaeon]